MNTKIDLILNGVEERLRYELQMLIREFLPFAEFDAPIYDLTIRIDTEKVQWEENGKNKTCFLEGSEAYTSDPLKNRIKVALYDLLSEYTHYNVPWGTLTGVRPTKIAWTLLDLGLSPEEVKQHIAEINKVQPIFKRIYKTEFRDTEFEKTELGKIKR